MIRTVIAACLATSLAVPAVADRGNGNKHGCRGAVRQVRNDGCPPGLAKKNNGCRPPGQAKKSYVVGRRLPTTVRWYEPAPVVIRRLAPAPVGYRYVVVDDDLLLMELASRLIVRLID